MDIRKSYLITGGTGFLGVKLTECLLQKGHHVIVIARNEGKLITLKEKFPSITIVPGDISSKETVYRAVSGVDGIFHLAAFKHVGLAEEYQLECINSNIIGTKNILECSLDNRKLEFIIGISTDKACQVNGVYGASKYIMEHLFYAYEKLNSHVKYRLVRYGNVLYSTGSVLCKWKDKLSKGEEIIITDENITRFYWTVDEAIDLIFKCLEKSVSSKPYVPTMKSVLLKDLLDVMIEKYHPKDMPVKIKKIGIQRGENYHEKIEDNGKYSNEVEFHTREELLTMI